MLPDAIISFSKASVLGGSVVLPYDSYSYGASLIPDEDEMKSFPVTLGKVIDPDGYLIEVIEGSKDDPFSKVILGVEDLNDSISFYTESLKMDLLRRRSNLFNKPKSASMCAYVVRHAKSISIL